MTLSALASISEIVASLGVIISLIFVALELRKNTAQSKLSNYSDMINRYNSVYAITNDIGMSELIVRGRQSYAALSDAEKLSFGHYLEQVCIANESSLVYDESVVHQKGLSKTLWAKHIRFHLGFPGAREWFNEFEQQRGFPPTYMSAIHSVIDEDPPSTGDCASGE
jgi:hypothetical protein